MKYIVNFFKFIGNIFALLFFVVVIVGVVSAFNLRDKGEKPPKGSVLVLDLTGVIIDGKKFLKDLRKYRELEEIKAVLININSPGGVVGPSQEIYAEIKRVRDEFKKPVVAACSGLAASGAFYSAVAADKIVTNPGTLMGSIGVIMEFANLEKLYDWAKIKRYVIKTGEYKDTGADYRAMNEPERKLLEATMYEVLDQFKQAVAEGRNLPIEKVTAVADGRIFTGATAVKLGMADQLGTYTDALKLAAQLGGIEGEPHVFEPSKFENSWRQILEQLEEESSSKITRAFKQATGTQLLGQPLFLMPGAQLQ